MQEIKFTLAIEEVNLVLEALGQLPFARVYALVGSLQEQAARQIRAAGPSQPEAVPVTARPAAALK